jgi:hypothetical protein
VREGGKAEALVGEKWVEMAVDEVVVMVVVKVVVRVAVKVV